jgi:hypothetical protein
MLCQREKGERVAGYRHPPVWEKRMKKQIVRLDRVMEELRRSLPELEKRYKVKALGVFGSYVRGEQDSKSVGIY